MLGRTNAGGGGGGGLNFKVVPNPQPSTAKENTIWVDTDKINNYYFSATQPENMVDYDVWFPTGTASSMEFNALKRNGIQVYPLLAWQNVNGELVRKTAQTYQDGEWKAWITYLYQNGNECTDITKGWVYVPEQGSSCTKYEDRITISSSYSAGQHHAGGAFCPDNAIDLTDVNTIYALCEASIGSTGGVYPGLFASLTKPSSATEGLPAYLMLTNTSEPTWFALDVSGLSGKYYVGLGMHIGHYDGSATATLRELYMSA